MDSGPVSRIATKRQDFGRGAQVSKSDVVMYLYAVVLAARYADPTFPVTVALTGDEEVGGMVGPYRLLSENYSGRQRLPFALAAPIRWWTTTTVYYSGP